MPRRFLPVLAAALVFGATAASAAPLNPSQLIVFGDSLVDAGNLDIAVGSDIYNPVSKGYFPGRFTNGPDYTDLLNQRLYGSYQTPALLGTGGTNYAFGGARVVDNSGFAVGGDAVPDLNAQIGGYLFGHAVDANALYVLNFGGNDVFALQAGTIGSYTPTSYATAVVDTLANAVLTLDSLGAGHILITGIPNSAALDAALQARLDTIQPLLGADLLRFSYLDFFAGVMADPTRYGVPPITQAGACFDFRSPVNGHIDCSGFATVDGTHPIAPIQAAIYRQVGHIIGLGAVPEPGTWLMMITGFGLVGTTLRRRQKVHA